MIRIYRFVMGFESGRSCIRPRLLVQELLARSNCTQRDECIHKKHMLRLMKSIKEHQYFGFWVHCSGEREGERERERERDPLVLLLCIHKLVNRNRMEQLETHVKIEFTT